MRLALLLLWAGLLLAGAPRSGEADPEDGGSPPGARERALEHLRTAPRLLGDAGGPRRRLEDLGIEVQLFYHQVLAWNADGGADPDGEAGHSASYDFLTRARLEPPAGWEGLELLLHVKGQYDRNVNAAVGALSDPIDDADLDEAIYVSQLWIQQSFLGDRARLRVGFLEQQTFFDRNAYANSEDLQFLSTFLDNDPVVPLANGLGVSLLLLPARWIEIAAGVADADNVPRRAGFETAFDDFESLHGYLELAFRPRLPIGGRGRPGTFRIGGFRDGRDRVLFGRVDAMGRPRSERGHWGAYLSADQELYGAPEGGGSLGAFARVGWADGDASRIEWFGSAGLELRGFLPGRDRDVAGLAGYQARISDRLRAAGSRDLDRETGFEAYCRIAALPWLDVTPDLQYILDPGADERVDDAWVVTLRFRVTF